MFVRLEARKVFLCQNLLFESHAKSSDVVAVMLDQESAGDPANEAESVSNLRELPPGPFRSLGRVLDYSDWPDRDRFLELDKALSASRSADSEAVRLQKLLHEDRLAEQSRRDSIWTVSTLSPMR